MGEPEQTTTETSNLSPPDARAFLIVPRANFDSYTRPRRSDFGGSPPVCDLQVRIKFLELIKIKKSSNRKIRRVEVRSAQFIRPDRNGAGCARQGTHIFWSQHQSRVGWPQGLQTEGRGTIKLLHFGPSRGRTLSVERSSDRWHPESQWDSKLNPHGRFDAPRDRCPRRDDDCSCALSRRPHPD